MAPPSEICFGHQIPCPYSDIVYDDEEKEDDDDEGEESEEEMDEGEELTASSPLIMPAAAATTRGGPSVVEMVTGALRRSLMMCTTSGARQAAPEEDGAAPAAAGMQIGMPTDVRHVSHVTFDRFSGFLGLPADLEPDVPRPVPSARSAYLQVSDSLLLPLSIRIHA
jgi:hypothetical protein